MAKDTKNVIIGTLFNTAAENWKLMVEEILKRSYITRTTIKSNFPAGVSGMVEYAHLNIVCEVNERLLKYKCGEVSMEGLADILLPVLGQHKEKAHVIYSSQLPFRLIGTISDETWEWAKERFNGLIKQHGLVNYFSRKELLKYFNAQLVTVLTLWVEANIKVFLICLDLNFYIGGDAQSMTSFIKESIELKTQIKILCFFISGLYFNYLIKASDLHFHEDI